MKRSITEIKYKLIIMFLLVFICLSTGGRSQTNLISPASPSGSTGPTSLSNQTSSPGSLLIPNTITMNLAPPGTSRPEQISGLLKIVILVTILSLAPSILIMMTSFTRIVIVLSFIRRALSLNEVPPTSVLMALALFLTAFSMAPTWQKINTQALQPYFAKQISDSDAIKNALDPVRDFMIKQTRKKDLALFYSMSNLPRPKTKDDIPTYVLIPAFMISELKTSFLIGFLIYLPFLVIDMVVSAILLSMGMMMLPPVIISLPFKIILFVLVDGWNLIIGALLKSYM